MDVNEIVSKLEDSVKADNATVESSTTGNKETVATEAAKTESGKGTAQDRIRELVAEREAFKARLQATEERLGQKDSEISKLIDSVKQREAASRIVDRINELHSQGQMTAEIEALDAAIRGVQVEARELQAKAEVTSLTKPDNSELQKVQQQVQRAQQEALEAVNAQKNELLLMKSQLVVEKLFGQLPDTDYNDQDRKVLQNALVDHVDWEAIEADPNVLENEVARGFQSTVNWYGDPRGKLSNQTTQVTDESKQTKAETVDFTKLELGKVVKDDKGNARPVIGDNEFKALLAEEMRRSRPGR